MAFVSSASVSQNFFKGEQALQAHPRTDAKINGSGECRICLMGFRQSEPYNKALRSRDITKDRQ